MEVVVGSTLRGLVEIGNRVGAYRLVLSKS